MRAQEIYEKIKNAGVEHLIGHFPNPGVIADVVNLRSRLEWLRGIPGFQDELTLLEKSIIFRTTSIQIQIPPDEWRSLQNAISRLIPKLLGLRQYLNAFLAQQDQISVFVKIPDFLDFAAVIDFEVKLQKTLSQIIFHSKIKDGVRLELRSWERGSPLWLELFLGTQAAVNVVAASVWAGAVVYKKIQEGRLHQEYVRGLKLRNDNLEAILEAEKRLLNEIVDAEANNIALSCYDGENSQETLERVKYTIKEFAEMIEKGAEIHPALQAPESVQNLFPDFKNVSKIESKIKQLAEKSQAKSQ